MKNIAVIVDSRGVEQSIIDGHLEYLPASHWDLDVVTSHDIRNGHDYNRLLTMQEFWEQYIEYNRVLIFQHDSMLLRSGIDEFLQWDYVGAPWFETAPWAHPERKGGNGGLSIRNPIAMIDCLRHFAYNPSLYNEDVFYVHNLEKCDWQVAPFEVCERFACETMFSLGTLGYHQIESHLSKEEIKLIKTQYH